MHETRWSMDIFIDEHEDGRTRATARLHCRDSVELTGTGLARRNPIDSNIPEIGDELAVARALADLTHQLLEASAADIESLTGKPAHVTA